MSNFLPNDLMLPLLEPAVIYEVTDATTLVDCEGFQESPPVFTCGDYMVIWAILPCLLWIDFSVAFLMDERKATEALSFGLVQLAIALFCIAAFMYRSAMHEIGVTNACLVLMPEIMVDLVLLPILVGRLLWAFNVLLLCILLLSITVLVFNALALCKMRRREKLMTTAKARNEQRLCRVV
jgi:hypothetical protein